MTSHIEKTCKEADTVQNTNNRNVIPTTGPDLAWLVRQINCLLLYGHIDVVSDTMTSSLSPPYRTLAVPKINQLTSYRQIMQQH